MPEEDCNVTEEEIKAGCGTLHIHFVSLLRFRTGGLRGS
jgi:hypothetical protein